MIDTALAGDAIAGHWPGLVALLVTVSPEHGGHVARAELFAADGSRLRLSETAHEATEALVKLVQSSGWVCADDRKYTTALSGRLDMKRPTRKQMERACAAWDSRCPIGTRVRYWKGLREGSGHEGETTSTGHILGGHTAGVYVGGAGFIAFTHVEVKP